MSRVILCVPLGDDSRVDPRWGRAAVVAVAEVLDGRIGSWREFRVDWDRLHDEGGPGRHHARVARFLLEHHVERVVADHVGEGLVRMLATMSIGLRLGAEGLARDAVLAAAA